MSQLIKIAKLFKRLSKYMKQLYQHHASFNCAIKVEKSKQICALDEAY